jgi:hypothetical protein
MTQHASFTFHAVQVAGGERKDRRPDHRGEDGHWDEDSAGAEQGVGDEPG